MDNYPMGVNGSDPYFNWDDPPECPNCNADLKPAWDYCPWCGAKVTHYEGDEEC